MSITSVEIDFARLSASFDERLFRSVSVVRRVNNRFQEMLTFIIAVLMSFALARVSGFVRDDCVCGVANTDSRRIIKGTVTEPSKYPWMVALYSTEKKAYCGGALISDKHVKRVSRGALKSSMNFCF